ncbi:MAG: glycosyltransferase family 1 protein, partial [Chloroflexi bacterium]
LCSGEGPLTQRFREMDVPVTYGTFPFFSKRRPWEYWGVILSYVRLMRRWRIGLVHVNCDRAVPHMVLAGRLARVPVLCHIHDMTRAWFLPRYVRYLNRSARIIADSQATARHCLAAGMDKHKIQVIYECFEMERFANWTKEARRQLRAEWGIMPQEVAIGLVGQVLRHKGHEEFIRAAVLVVKEFPATRFVIVGDDALSSDKDFLPFLRGLVLELGLSSHVLFAGYREDIPRVMASLDIITVPSWAEPFGRVAVEALASRRPVVATKAGGIPEIVEDGVTGLLVPPKDPEALAQALLRLCRDPDLRARMGRLGPATARRFDVTEHARQFEQTYEAILKGHLETLPKVPFGMPSWLPEMEKQ